MRAGVAKGRVKKGGRGKRAATVGVADAVAMATVAMISAMTALAALSGVLSEPAAAATPVRRGPGRPRKRALNPGEATPSQETGAVQVADGQSGEQGVTPAKRRRGRLRKDPLTVEMTLPPSGSETVAQSNVEGDSVPVSAELGAMKPSENMNVVLPGPVAGPQ